MRGFLIVWVVSGCWGFKQLSKPDHGSQLSSFEAILKITIPWIGFDLHRTPGWSLKYTIYLHRTDDEVRKGHRRVDRVLERATSFRHLRDANAARRHDIAQDVWTRLNRLAHGFSAQQAERTADRMWYYPSGR